MLLFYIQVCLVLANLKNFAEERSEESEEITFQQPLQFVENQRLRNEKAGPKSDTSKKSLDILLMK